MKSAAIVFKAFVLASLLTLGIACKKGGGEGETNTPIDPPANPTNPTNPNDQLPVVQNPETEPNLLSEELISFLLRKDSRENCGTQEIKLIQQDGSEQIHTSIQEAVDVSLEGAEIRVGRGFFPERVKIEGKSNLKIISNCIALVKGILINKSSDILIRGLQIDASDTGVSAVHIRGRFHHEVNNRIILELNDIYGADGGHGVEVGRYNKSIKIINNYIHNAGKDGVNFDKSGDADSLVEGNLIAQNDRNGVRIDKKKKLVLRDNVIIDNGRTLFSTEKYGVFREKGFFSHSNPRPVTLLNNIITYNNGVSLFDRKIRDIGNAIGILDEGDSQNITTSGAEGPGVTKLDDQELPQVRLGIENGYMTQSAIAQIPILVMDKSKVEVSVSQNAQEILFTESFSFTLNATLNEGSNVFVVRAKDAQRGLETTKTFIVNFVPDKTNPTIPSIPIVRCNIGEVYAIDNSGDEHNFDSLQEAIDEAEPNWTVFAGAGEFNDVFFIDGKSQIIIKSLCQAQVKAFEVISSERVTIDGFVVNADGERQPAIYLHGNRSIFKRHRHNKGRWFRKSDEDNQLISIINNEIYGADKGYSGIYIDRGNEDTLVFNNYIHDNGRDGIHFEHLSGGPHKIEKNTISRNAQNGIEVELGQVSQIINNIIIDNGTSSGWGVNRYGIYLQRGFGSSQKHNFTLSGNTIANNNGKVVPRRSSRDIGNYDLILDNTDGLNYTTDGSESENFSPLNDTDQPMLTVATVGGFRTPNPIFVVPVAVMDMSPMTTEVLNNGQVIKTSQLFQFQTVITLEEEDNNIIVRSTDFAGNVVEKSLETIILDTIPPELSNFFPEEGETFYTNTFSILVSGKANEDISEAEVNGVPLSIMSDQITFSGVVSVSNSAPLALNYRVADLVKNTTEQTVNINVVIDQVSPVVNLTGDQNIFTNQEAYSFAVDVTEENPVTTRVYQNGQMIQESTEKNFTVNATLTEGSNTFEVEAEDAATNFSEVAKLESVVLDTVPPVITVAEPGAGQLIQLFHFPVEGNADEPLLSMRVVGQGVGVSGSSFSGTIEAPVEGNIELVFLGTDRAGNTTQVKVPVFISLRLLNIELVKAEPSPNFGRINIVGGQGAARPGARITVQRGLFSSDSTIANEKGAFLIETDSFSQVTLISKDLSTGEQETKSLSYNQTTTLSGIIRDDSEASLPNVRVKIIGTNKTTFTNGSGVFSFTNPPTGFQELELDGSTIPSSIVGTDRKFSKISIDVNIGAVQQNVIERPIYLPALMLDGTETQIVNGSAATVTSPHAPGVVLQIPSGVTTFPNGSTSGAINLGIVPAERSTIPVLKAAVPDTVVSLEPSGLKFTEPVQLTLPNDNELPEGVDFAILSLNSKSGQWELDGVATVDPGGQTLTTKSGQGITHFSEVYAVPITPHLRNLGDVSNPGIDAFGGALTREITLPSFKSLGQDIAPRLIYRSAWANPTATVNHFIDIPPQEMTITRNESGVGAEVCNIIGTEECLANYANYWHYVTFQFDQVFKSAYQPESISGKLYIGDLLSEVSVPNNDPSIPFETVPNDVEIEALQGLPNQSVISYGVELKDKNSGEYLKSGIYPTLGRYEIKLKHLTITTTRFARTFDREVKGFFGKKKRITQTDVFAPPPTVESQVLENVLPHDVGGELVVKNQVNSSAGRGWDIAGVQKIINPKSNSLIIDEGNGSTSTYRLNDKIETVWRDFNSDFVVGSAMDLSQVPNVTVGVYKNSTNQQYLANINLNSRSSGYSLETGINGASGTVWSVDHYNCTEGHITEFEQNSRRWSYARYNFHQKVDVSSVLRSNGNTFLLEKYGHRLLSQQGGGISTRVGVTQTVPEIEDYGSGNQFLSQFSMNNICKSRFGRDCQLLEQNTNRSCAEDANYSSSFGQCSQIFQSGAGLPRRMQWGACNITFDQQLFNKNLFTQNFSSPLNFWQSTSGGIWQVRNPTFFSRRIIWPRPDMGTDDPSFAQVDAQVMFFDELKGILNKNLNSGSIYTASSSTLNSPSGLVLNNSGNVLIADTGNNRIRQYNPVNGSFSTFAGNGQTNGLGDGGSRLSASFVAPRALVVDSDGSVYVATGANKIRKIDSSGIVSTYAGSGAAVDSADSEIHVSQLAFNQPSGLLLDKGKGYLYVADTNNHRIIQINLSTDKAIAIAGNRSCQGQLGDGGPALNASICSPSQMGLDSDGNLYVWDRGHNAIRKIIFGNADGALFAPVALDNSMIEKNSNGSFTRRLRNGTTIQFDAEGKQTLSTDRVGRKFEFTYDSQDRLVEVKDPVGQKITYNYSGSQLQSIVDPAGRATSFGFSGNLLSQVNFPDGTGKSFTYANGLMTEERDQRNNETRFEYTEYNRLAKTIRADQSEISGEDVESKATGNNSSPGSPKQLAKLGTEEGDLYDGVKDPRNIETKFVRDINGYVTTFEDGEGRVFRIERDQLGKVLKIYRPDGSTASFTYDTNTQDLLKREDSSGLTIENNYNSFGQVTRQIGEDQLEVTNSYNGNGLLISRSLNGQVKEENSYNSLGLVTTKSLPTGSGDIDVHFVYDSKGRVISRQISSGEETLFEYDAAGNVIKKTERVAAGEDKITEFEYDNFNRLITVVLPDDTVTTYSYLLTGELSEVQDDLNNKVIFVYDVLGQLTRKTDQNGRVNQRFYDANGNVSKTIDPAGHQVTFAYDNLDRVIEKTLPDDLLTFSYDTRGNVSSLSNDTSVITNSYDNRDRLTGSTVSGRGAMATYPAQAATYNYNLDGTLKNMTHSSVGTTAYVYDSQNRLTSLINHKNENFGFSYDVNNRLVQVTRPGSETLLTLNDSSFIAGIDHRSGGVSRSIANYQRNDLGFATQLTNSYGVNAYSYDANSQLTSATHPVNSHGTLTNETYSYDSIGNRLSDHTGTYSYGLKKQLLEEDARNFYSYDSNGNLMSRTNKITGHITKYEYSSENQLKRLVELETLTGPTLKEVTYEYDALGRRMQKSVIDNTALADLSKTFTRRYAYDGNEVVAELNENNDILAKYTHSRLRTDDVLAADITSAGVTAKLATSTGSYFYLKDALGTVTDVMNSSGTVLQTYAYSAFGELVKVLDGVGVDITETPILSTAFTFTGREFDRDTGLYYYRARYYDPSVGRFLQRDPFAGGMPNPLTVVNAYVYAINSPVAFTDPDGKFVFTAILISAAIAGSITAIQGGSFGDILNSALLGGIGAAIVIGGAYGGVYLAGLLTGAGGAAAVGSTAAIIGGATGGAVAGGGFSAAQGASGGGIALGALAGGISGGLLGVTGFQASYSSGNIQEDALGSIDSFNRSIQSPLTGGALRIVPSGTAKELFQEVLKNYQQVDIPLYYH